MSIPTTGTITIVQAFLVVSMLPSLGLRSWLTLGQMIEYNVTTWKILSRRVFSLSANIKRPYDNAYGLNCGLKINQLTDTGLEGFVRQLSGRG